MLTFTERQRLLLLGVQDPNYAFLLTHKEPKLCSGPPSEPEEKRTKMEADATIKHEGFPVRLEGFSSTSWALFA